MLTRVFKSGNSLAVRIPKELAFADGAQDVDIERVGNTLVLRPVVQMARPWTRRRNKPCVTCLIPIFAFTSSSANRPKCCAGLNLCLWAVP
ncbi:AbrB/MazE/SpoVT family DNA-binding domain-containing protein [Rhodoferax sp.]|uniref:AbrB/MazE/SpoVT family DNA-binding domain-containing protein n=1 Tax=Rhodoferax sp. TaxID=50421 RepID=UPI00261BF07D|nr:AbrB/MazE/SpoVT family DNA-binding domain-containing protein [Rhodoferax sp.]MDD2808824.1 AbrB/MazE/SpoVT family DNA-binding domain-containing protein [Rhodoferax sp.]MDD4942630.1 AbrB/MazE/SpoVT family DNA-binding domain-containing protein [Rhodoferax sp.]